MSFNTSNQLKLSIAAGRYMANHIII